MDYGCPLKKRVLIEGIRNSCHKYMKLQALYFIKISLWIQIFIKNYQNSDVFHVQSLIDSILLLYEKNSVPAQNQGSVLANFLYDMDFRVGSYKKWTLAKHAMFSLQINWWNRIIAIFKLFKIQSGYK